MLSKRETVLDFVANQYGVTAEYPFKDDLETAVLRHSNGKWFGIIMHVREDRLGLSGSEKRWVINLKNHPEVIMGLKCADGFLPAYHMNKEKWFTALLDGSVDDGLLFALIDESYNIIGLKTKNKRK